MSSQILCRLCLGVIFGNNYKKLINTNGACNEAYDIVRKFFDPMLIINDQEHNHAILCSICWQHIDDFHYFQQKVYQAHLKFDKLNCSDLKVECVYDMNIVDDNWDEQQKKENHTANKDFDLKDEKPLMRQYENDNVDDNCDEHQQKIDNHTSANKDFDLKDEKPLMPQYAKENDNAKIKKKGIKRKYKGDCSTKNKSKTPHHSLKTKFLDEAHNSCNTRNKTVENDDFITSWRNELDCVKCNATFASFTLLRKHFLKNHTDEKCYIVCCDRKFRSRYHIVEHIKLHINPNAYRCDTCGKCSTNSRNLAQHKKDLHSEERKHRNLECPTCLKILATKNSLRVHMETHETNLIYCCQECGKGFPSEQKRTLHERSVHKANLVCDQCGKKLHNHYAMKQHQLKHAGVQKRKWPCDLCKTELNSQSSLKRHKQLIHQERTTVYVCSNCGKVATTEIALRTHKRNVHLSERNHKCSFCEKAFKSPRALREHIATHTGEDLYQCPHCEKTFKTSANMHHHRKKVHPQEWAESRLNRPQATKVNFNSVNEKIVI